jgi:hypothetical protein
MSKANQEQAACCRARSVEVEWMAAALNEAKRCEGRFLALAGLIREHWLDDQIIALANKLHSGRCHTDRDMAMTAIEASRRQHSKLLLELLLADPCGDPSDEVAAQPFRAS